MTTLSTSTMEYHRSLGCTSHLQTNIHPYSTHSPSLQTWLLKWGQFLLLNIHIYLNPSDNQTLYPRNPIQPMSSQCIWSDQLLAVVCKKNNLDWWMKLISKFFLINYFISSKFNMCHPHYLEIMKAHKTLINWLPAKCQKYRFWGFDEMKWVFISPKCNQGKCVIEEMHVWLVCSFC